MRRKLVVLRRYVVPLLSVAAVTVLMSAVTERYPPDRPGQMSSPLLLGVVAISAWYGGIGAGVFASVLSLLSLELVFLPPVGAIEVQWRDLPRLIVFLGASLLIGQLTVKRQAAESVVNRANHDLRAAQVIQQRLLPNSSPIVPGLDIAGATFPADTVGGDYFDYIPLQSGRLAMIIGDVSGHGLGPALLMAEARAYLRALALTRDDFSEILTLTNGVLMDDTEEQFVTLFCLNLDPESLDFEYFGAGHDAFLFASDGAAFRLSSVSLPLGVEEHLVAVRQFVGRRRPSDDITLMVVKAEAPV